MKDNVTISLFELSRMIPNAESARIYIEKRRWPKGPVCPECNATERIGTRKDGYYRCHSCKVDFTVRTGTIFERSHIPLDKWLFAMYLLMTARKGISSLQLSKELSITQKSAWFMLHRIREACGSDFTALNGIVEIDEMYVGGKEKNKHANKKLNSGRGAVGKTPVLGMRERGGRTKAVSLSATDAETMQAVIRANISPKAVLYTDEHTSYIGLGDIFKKHKTVNHKQGEYVNGDVSTNGIESVWAVIKRGIYGVYHQISDKHTDRYVNEFSFRLNEGNVEVPTVQRIASLLKASVGKRLTYKVLTA